MLNGFVHLSLNKRMMMKRRREKQEIMYIVFLQGENTKVVSLICRQHTY